MKKNAMSATQKAIQKAEEKLKALLQKQNEIKQQISEQTKIISSLKEQNEQEIVFAAFKTLKEKGFSAENVLAMAESGDAQSLREAYELLTGDTETEDEADEPETEPLIEEAETEESVLTSGIQ